MLMTIEQIKEVANASEQSKFYFKPATMRWWRSRVSSKVYPTKWGTVFVQSDDPGRISNFNSLRVYTVKVCADDGTIRTVGGFGDYATLKDAHRAAKAEARERIILTANS